MEKLERLLGKFRRVGGDFSVEKLAKWKEKERRAK